ncbi:hypothetical protein ACWCOW_14255 [Streptomyces sp. NPDC001939]|uniref:hypothetical protein n=1 Tax=unclassified Streptomyces TaxID=2593676 RepID=UPI0033325874
MQRAMWRVVCELADEELVVAALGCSGGTRVRVAALSVQGRDAVAADSGRDEHQGIALAVLAEDAEVPRAARAERWTGTGGLPGIIWDPLGSK